MKRISEITKRDIYELFRDGYEDPYSSWLDDIQNINYYYAGGLNEIDFLKRLYPKTCFWQWEESSTQD